MSSLMHDYLIPETPRPLFSDAQWLEAMLTFESQLAQAEAECSVISQDAADAISRACECVTIDRDTFVRQARQSGAIGVALVRPLQQWLSSHAPDAAQWLHWGSTTQDVVDTANAMLTQEALKDLQASLGGLCAQLERLANEHADTPTMARTLMQPAQVTSFGLKCAQMARVLAWQSEQLKSAAQSALVVQLGGAVGNRASLGDKALPVEKALAHRLQLGASGGGWHTQRAPWMRLGMEVAVLCGSFAKLAKDWALLSQFEVGEISESMHGSTSSAMPHKRNPVHCMQAIALTQAVPQMAATLLSCMPQAHERALGEWQAEVAQWPALWRHAIAACRALEQAAEGLQVHESRMKANIDALRQVIFSESFVQALAPLLGQVKASELVSVQSERALTESRPLGLLLQQWLEHSVEPDAPRHQASEMISSVADLDNAVAASAHECRKLMEE